MKIKGPTRSSGAGTSSRALGVWFAALTCQMSPAALADDAPRIESLCFGSEADGRLEHGRKLPASGANFVAYSSLAGWLGRTYVHTSVYEIVLAAYEQMRLQSPGKVFMYGETGASGGGRFRPHRTHQNGLSVDFMVPVLDPEGNSVPLSTNAFNRFGYDLEFDAHGKLSGNNIDFPAIAEHLYQLDRAARARGLGIALVIFEPRFLPFLYATERGDYLQEHITFMKRQAWVRHDEHYHVDFAVPCLPLSARTEVLPPPA